MVSTPVIHVITWITTHLPTPKRWKAELAYSTLHTQQFRQHLNGTNLSGGVQLTFTCLATCSMDPRNLCTSLEILDGNMHTQSCWGIAVSSGMPRNSLDHSADLSFTRYWTRHTFTGCGKKVSRKICWPFPQQSLGISKRNFPAYSVILHVRNSFISIQLAFSVLKLSALKCCYLAILACLKTSKQSHSKLYHSR